VKFAVFGLNPSRALSYAYVGHTLSAAADADGTGVGAIVGVGDAAGGVGDAAGGVGLTVGCGLAVGDAIGTAVCVGTADGAADGCVTGMLEPDDGVEPPPPPPQAVKPAAIVIANAGTKKRTEARPKRWLR
jgi:hypothetical protein